jgi:flagellin
LTISNYTSAGVIQNQTGTVTANDDAATVASNLSALTGVSATAFNKVSITDISNNNTDFSVDLTFNGSGLASTLTNFFTGSDAMDYSTLAATINADTDLQSGGVYAINTGTGIDIYAMGGQDITLAYGSAATATGSVTVASAFNGGGSATIDETFSGSSHTRGGRVDVALDQGYTLSTSAAAGLFSAATGTVASTAVGVASTTAISNNATVNSVEQQDITISGSTGSQVVTISANDDAYNIATKINNVSATTNVKAKAVTTATLSGLSANGQVTFNLYGNNQAAASITASVTTGDLTPLIQAVNNSAGNTGITAAVGENNTQIILTHATGKNIGITNFTHSAAVAYQDPDALAVADDGTSVVAQNTVTLNVTGNASTNTNGGAVTLKDGGTATMTGQNSTVVGGHVEFSSTATFSMTSSIAGGTTAAAFTGSLFGVAANYGNTSTASTVNTVNIKDVTGANAAISILDGAVNQISAIRATLGAIQSRFKSTIENLSNNIENLNVARSRIQDADFAEETANLSKNQILQQAGISVLAQANQLPQSVLKLLG